VAEINLTPFVDIMLCLLVVFMVAAPLMQQGLDVNLPQAKARIMERSEEDIILTVKKDGSIYMGNENIPLTIGFLEEKLLTVYKDQEKKDLYIKADENVIYGRVVSIMSIAKSAGVHRIGIITKPIRKTNNKAVTKSSKLETPSLKPLGEG
jgi:biopolymer transport protein TolR